MEVKTLREKRKKKTINPIVSVNVIITETREIYNLQSYINKNVKMKIVNKNSLSFKNINTSSQSSNYQI